LSSLYIELYIHLQKEAIPSDSSTFEIHNFCDYFCQPHFKTLDICLDHQINSNTNKNTTFTYISHIWYLT